MSNPQEGQKKPQGYGTPETKQGTGYQKPDADPTKKAKPADSADTQSDKDRE